MLPGSKPSACATALLLSVAICPLLSVIVCPTVSEGSSILTNAQRSIDGSDRITATEAPAPSSPLLLDEFSYVAEEIRPVNVALEIRRYAFGHARTTWVRIRTRVRYEVFDRTVPGTPYPNASLSAQVIGITCLRECKLPSVCTT